ncbi:MAG: hypothetical protein JWM78_1244 [Verrucomicrobiaceae bacterium]|nr:hypothetical protein [Verrucomicrobiaceae bacterium]
MADSQSKHQAKKRAQSSDQSSNESIDKSSARDLTGQESSRESGDSDKKPGVQLAEEKATAGQLGECNLRIEWIDVWVGNSKPCQFNVVTADGNNLEIELTQLSYRKTYAGAGAVKTDVLPIVPIGTRGKLIARDITTGEVLEQTWIWHSMGQSFFGWLIATARKLFVG